MIRNKAVFTFISILVALMVVIAWPGKTEGDSQFKNVQILTDLSPDQLEDYMAGITESLGVKKCTFCHVKDKSSDENEHKVIARKFMKMTKELNEGFFKESDDKVTCYTCHRGEVKPANSIEEAEKRAAEKK